MKHLHELDLIAALAEGTLQSSDAERAHRLMSDCETCRDEYSNQIFVLQALADLDRPVMTDLERRRLHRAVSEQPKVGWLTKNAYKVGAVAAGLAVVAAGAGIFSGGNDMSQTDSPDAGAAASIATGQTNTQREMVASEAGPLDATHEDDTAETGAAAAPEAPIAEGDLSLRSRLFGYLSKEDLDGVLKNVAESSMPTTQSPVPCRERIPESAVVLDFGDAELEGVPVHIVAFTFEEETYVTAFELETCTPLESLPDDSPLQGS